MTTAELAAKTKRKLETHEGGLMLKAVGSYSPRQGLAYIVSKATGEKRYELVTEAVELLMKDEAITKRIHKALYPMGAV